MKQKLHSVRGHMLPAPRATLSGLLWVATMASIPIFLLLSMIELAGRYWL